nr:FAD_TeRes [uncultured bacterium]
MPHTKKILVIGASVAGPALCYWLNHYGFQPTLVEKNQSTRKGGYAIDLRGIAVDVAKQMGIYDSVCAMRTSLQCVRYVDAAGNLLFEEHGEKGGFRQGDEVEIVRGDLVDILMKTITDIPCFYDHAIESLTQHDDHVTVQFKNGKTENYDLVIAADGLHSATRRMVFSKDDYHLRNLGCYISVFSIPNYLQLDHCETLLEAKQKLVSITSDKDSTKAFAGFMFRSSNSPNDIRDEASQKDFLRENFTNHGWESNKLLSLMNDANDFYFDAIMQVKMKDWTKGRIALVGDAGYTPSPLSGQGTSLALVGAYILAGELKTATDHVAAFARYNELLKPYVEANQAFGVWVSESFLADEPLSAEQAEERNNIVLGIMKKATHAIELPEY